MTNMMREHVSVWLRAACDSLGDPNRHVFAALIALDLDGPPSLRARRGRRLRVWKSANIRA
jgi:hypothetical protein